MDNFASYVAKVINVRNGLGAALMYLLTMIVTLEDESLDLIPLLIILFVLWVITVALAEWTNWAIFIKDKLLSGGPYE